MNILIILTVLFLVLIYFLRKISVKYYKIILLSSLVFYLIPILLVKYDDYILEKKMKKFDLNNDGFYSKNEINYEFEELEHELISDSGTNLFIIFGYPLCLAYSLAVVLIYSLLNFLKIKITS